MSGHSKWSQIKHKKAITDLKRGKLFSKLLAAISISARGEQNPEFNPRLRTAIEKAKSFNVPQENIERAIKKASEVKDLEELMLEAYGPGGTALFIGIITDSKNRTISEIKQILRDNNAKWAESGSVQWAFDVKIDNGEKIYKPKFEQNISEDEKKKLEILLGAIEEQDDVQCVFCNAQR